MDNLDASMSMPDMSYPIIRYIVLLGKRSAPNPFSTFPPACMRHVLLQYLSSLPHNLFHFLDGCNYFQRILLSGRQSELPVDFVFNDSIDDSTFSSTLSKGLNVFLICTDNVDDLIEMNISLSRVSTKNCLYWIEKDIKDKFLMPKVISSPEEFWDFLYDYSKPIIPTICDPLCVPKCAGSVTFPYFKPANITFYTLTSALGNWGVGTLIDSTIEVNTIIEKSNESRTDNNEWARQEKNIELINQLYGLSQDALKSAPKIAMGFSDQNYPPLIIAAPYTCKDIRDQFKQLASRQIEMKYVDKVVELEQRHNYCYDVDTDLINACYPQINSFISLFHGFRLDYLDFCANLHCSFKFSPYLRLPLLCKSINTELSYVGVNSSKHLAYSKDKMAYDKAIHRVGEILSKKLLSPKAADFLEDMPTQIVAMTDLPIEWLEVKGVPLAFSHDVCRIPETPAAGLLTHYGIARFSPFYMVPEDILSKTLVVYGCREEDFKEWQDKADIVANALGAKTEVCLSIDSFERAVKKHRPQFMIIDTHGDTDLVNHQSYIYMGDDKVYPKDIAQRGIYANLVFISACNTAPCYNEVNTIANAFLEIGASSITSSYLPLDIKESSTLYIRILNQLNIAAKQNIHRNWLAFISHMMRTSFIMTPLVESVKSGDNGAIDTNSITKVNSLSMVFENRATIYRKLKNGEAVEGLKYDFAKVVPHYLMYTTIGRADLIMFENSAIKRDKLYEEFKAN